MKVPRLILFLALLTAAPAARGDLTVSFSQLGSTPGLTGYVTQDILAQTSTRWYNAALLLSLTQGSIYQDSFGGDTPPNPALYGFVPTLPYDTFVTAGHIDFTQQPSFIGGAVDLGGAAAKQFNTQGLSATWYTTDYNNSGALTLARITLSNNAEGTFGLIVSNAGGDRVRINGGSIHQGVLGNVPEPSGWALGACGTLASTAWMAVRRRRRG